MMMAMVMMMIFALMLFLTKDTRSKHELISPESGLESLKGGPEG